MVSGRTVLVIVALLLATTTVMAALPPKAGVGPIPSPFIPSAKQIAALNSLHPMPFTGAAGAGGIPGAAGSMPASAVGSAAGPPTVPPAVASLIQKYQVAAAAFTPPAVLTAAPAKVLPVAKA